ncbi:MAG TPA: hypothetical protein VM890_16860 [Longimicrobium sp.]|jgi:hypothetical protein|nr:hypothetical protein [Longimicrobium sp.]
MRKVSLDVNELRVETFETEDDQSKARGTVQGYATQVTCPRTQCGQQCPTGPGACYDTAGWTNGQDLCFCDGTGTLD